MPTDPKNDSATDRFRRFQFSLRTLLIITALVAVIAAAFVWNELAGIFAYLGGLLLWLTVWRQRVASASADTLRHDKVRHVDRFGLTLSASLLIAAGAAIAFCCTCSVAQVPFLTLTTAEHSDKAEALFRTGLFVSMPLATLVVVYLYWGTWPVSPKS